MIFGNIADEKTYDFLPEDIKRCFSYFKTHDLAQYAQGTHEIDGRDFFVNIENYATVDRSKRFWEAHRKYIDVHMMIDGRETIDVAFLPGMKVISYDESRDFAEAKGEPDATVHLRHKGDFLICWPEDVHRTAIACGSAAKLKKAIFKVKL